MKTKLIILLIVAFPHIGNGQSAVDKLFDKYADKEGFSVVNISQYMFDMFRSNKTPDKQLDEVIGNLKSIRILSSENEKAIPAGTNFFKELMKELPISEYKELMTIKDKDSEVKFLIKETKGRITEFLLISGGKDNTLICIRGDFAMKDLAKLSKTLNIKGMESMDETK